MYTQLTMLTASLMIALGVTMLILTATHGGGVGLIIGVLFVAAGAGRLWIIRRNG